LKLQLDLADTSADLASDRVAQWKCNETAASTHVDDNTGSHDGVATATTDNFTATGKTNMTPCFNLAGTYAVEVTDHANLSFGNDTVDSPFSISAWVYVTDQSTQAIFSKWDTAAKQEYGFYLTADEKLRMTLHDEGASVSVYRTSDAALSTGWRFVVMTYTGQSTTGATAANFIKFYVDGVLVDSTATNNANYDAMNDLGAKAVIGAWYVNSLLENLLNFSLSALTSPGLKKPSLGSSTFLLAGISLAMQESP